MSKKDKQKVPGQKYINLTYNEMRALITSEPNSDPYHSKVLASSKASLMGRLSMILDKNKKLSEFGKSKKGVQWLVKMTNKLMSSMKKILSEDSYNKLYHPDRFIPWTDKAALAVLVPDLSADFGTLDQSMEIEVDESTNISFSGNGESWEDILTSVGYYLSQTSVDFDDFSLADASINPKFVQTINYGMDEFGKPIVNEAIAELHEYLNLNDVSEIEADRAALCQSLFGEIISACSRLIKSSGEGPFRDFMTDDEYITKDHVKDQSNLRNKVVNDLTTSIMKDIESQTRKSGPRSSGTQSEFWDQLSYSYTHAQNNIDQEFGKILDEVTEEFIEEWISNVGYVHPIPYVVGIDGQLDIGSIYEAVYCEDPEISEEAYKIWQKILKNSLGSDCVYAHVKKNTNKGAPYYTSKLTDLEWLNLVQSFENRKANPEFSSNIYPFIPGQRIQNSTIDGDDIKTRDRIIMQMAGIYIAHQAWNIPFLRKMKELPYFASYISHEKVGEILDNVSLDSNDFLLSMDYGKYDANCGPELKRDHLWHFIASVISDSTIPDNERNLKETTYTTNLAKEWKSFYTMAPIIIPGGVLYGLHGLFSGAPFTTGIGSLANLLKILAMIKYFRLKMKFLFIQGDDTALGYSCTDKQISLGDISEFMGNLHHSVAVDAVKQAFMKYDTNESCYIMFVGKYYFLTNPEQELPLNKPVYSMVDMFSRFVFPEEAKMSIDEKSIKQWYHYDFNSYKYVWKKPRKENKEILLDPSLVMSVRITQSLINTIHHPLHDKVVTHLVSKFPGLFKPIREFGNVKDSSVFDSDGTLLGIDIDSLMEGFGSQPTVKLILSLLDNIEHEYTELVYMEDVEKVIADIKALRRKSKDKELSDNDFKSQLGQAKKALGDKLSTYALNELNRIERG